MKIVGDNIEFEYLSAINESGFTVESQPIKLPINKKFSQKNAKGESEEINNLNKFVELGEYYGHLIASL